MIWALLVWTAVLAAVFAPVIFNWDREEEDNTRGR